MFRSNPKPEKLDGRIREIDRQLRDLRKAMRDLERTGRTNYVPPFPRERRPPPSAPESAADAAAARIVDSPVEPSTMEPSRPVASGRPAEIFETGTGELPRSVHDAGAPTPYPPWRRHASPPPVAAGDLPDTDEKRRFANYFSSGPFLPGRPLKGERHTQRNRAIAMIAVVVVLAYILYRVIF